VTTRGHARISGIVLAGGRGVRFGSDKLVAVLNGRPLVHWPILALAAVADEVVVVGLADAATLSQGLAVPVRFIADAEPNAGPLAGLITGLAEAAAPMAIVAGGDMPGLVPKLLLELARRARGAGFDAAALLDGDRPRPLPAAVRRHVALAQARDIMAAGGSSLRALLAALNVDTVTEADWRILDPAGTSLLDIDRPNDLDRLSN
jgi:molybdenum cofactor guanylyltransferase